MAYSKQTWQDLPDTTTPITASRLNNMENGIETNTNDIATNTTNIGYLANLNTQDKSSLVNAINEISQTTITQAQIVDGYSTSTTDAYSANYINGLIKSKIVTGTPDSNGFLSTGLGLNNVVLGVANISENAAFFTPFIERNLNRITLKCETWNRVVITVSVTVTVYYIEI